MPLRDGVARLSGVLGLVEEEGSSAGGRVNEPAWVLVGGGEAMNRPGESGDSVAGSVSGRGTFVGEGLS